LATVFAILKKFSRPDTSLFKTAMRYVEAAARSQHPEVAAAALAYLMAI